MKINIAMIALVAIALFSNSFSSDKLVSAQSECYDNICIGVEDGKCMSREDCGKYGEKYAWRDELCGKLDDKCGCCFLQGTPEPTNETRRPTPQPTKETKEPTTSSPTKETSSPTKPTSSPTKETKEPTGRPTFKPTKETNKPTSNPVFIKTKKPTAKPTNRPFRIVFTRKPTSNPTKSSICMTQDDKCTQVGGFCKTLPSQCPTSMKKDVTLCGTSTECFCCRPIQ